VIRSAVAVPAKSSVPLKDNCTSPCPSPRSNRPWCWWSPVSLLRRRTQETLPPVYCEPPCEPRRGGWRRPDPILGSFGTRRGTPSLDEPVDGSGEGIESAGREFCIGSVERVA